ncbi:unnamed protein product, partial [Urochloa humidicola]
DNIRLDVIINFMKCFPCMEKLYIKTHKASKNEQCHHSKDRIECLDRHLKKIWISNYSCKHVEFAKFFILNARVLQSLVLNVDHDTKLSSEWMEKERRQLLLDGRASIRAHIQFTSDDCFNYLNDV